MASIHIRVDTNVLKGKANQISNEVKKMEHDWKAIQDTIRSSKSYWQGDASNEHQKYLKEVSDDVAKILKRMKEHPVDLMKMAGVYNASESQASQLAKKLPDDVIV